MTEDTHTIGLTRSFAAPIEAVFAEWTEAENVAAWFAPEGYETISCEIDPVPGGSISVRYRGEDGVEIHELGRFTALDEPTALSFELQHRFASGENGPLLHVEVRLTSEGDVTRMEFTQTGIPSTTMRAGLEAGWQSCFDKLERHIEREKHDRAG